MSKAVWAEETPEQVTKNPLNDSPSKQLWTFPRQQRFRSEHKYCPHVSYNYDLSTTSKRRAGFGYGRRIEFKLNNRFTPSPLVYDLNKTLDVNVGKSFGMSREKIQDKGYISMERLKYPGPGEYNLDKRYNKEGYTMRPKTAYNRNYFIDDQQQALVPGPGQYKTIRTNIGRNFISKFRSTKTPNLLQYTSKRFEKSNVNPGPGNYLIRSITKTEPSAMNHTSTNGTLSKEFRTSFTDKFARLKIAPGPGNYRLPSDFGHYIK